VSGEGMDRRRESEVPFFRKVPRRAYRPVWRSRAHAMGWDAVFSYDDFNDYLKGEEGSE
jgi:hypothetical protein